MDFIKSIASTINNNRVASIGCIGTVLIGLLSYASLTAFNKSKPISLKKVQKDGGNGLVLRDGRILEYFIHGNPTGNKTLLAIHGANTTGKLFTILNSWAIDKDIKIISPTLPGYGLSSFLENYQLEDWVKDMEELLKSLNIKKFHVLGTSFGSIHAAGLACLYDNSCVENVGLYVAFAPPSSTHDPLKGSILDIFGKLCSRPLLKRLLEKYMFFPMLRCIAGKDSDVTRSIEYQWEGSSDCARLIYEPWRFNYKNMAQNRKVIIFSGTTDNCAPPTNQKRLKEEILGSKLVEYEGDHDLGIKKPAVMASHLELLFN